MLDTILITLLIVAICIVLLGVKVFFVKGGRFPNGHVSGNKAMRDRGNRLCAVAGQRSTTQIPFFPLMNWKKP